MRNCFHDVLKWLDDVEVEQVVLKMSFLIWEMHKSDWEKLAWLRQTSAQFQFASVLLSTKQSKVTEFDFTRLEKNWN